MRRLAYFWGLLFLSSCTSGSGSAVLPDAKKEEDTGDSDDSADKAAPVSGAYLTCYVPKPSETQEQMYGGCQVRDKAGNHVDMRRQQQKFSFVRPGGAKQNLPIAVFDLSKNKTKRMYFDVVYRINLPMAGASLQGTGVTRSQAGNYFLNIVPVMMPSSSLLSTIRAKNGQTATTPTKGTLKPKTQSSLKLTAAIRANLEQLSYEFARNPANQTVKQAVDANSNAFLATTTDQPGADQFVYNEAASWDSYPLTGESSGYDDGTYGYVGQGMDVTYEYSEETEAAPVYGGTTEGYYEDANEYGDMSTDSSLAESGSYTYDSEDWNYYSDDTSSAGTTDGSTTGADTYSSDQGYNDYDSWNDWESYENYESYDTGSSDTTNSSVDYGSSSDVSTGSDVSTDTEWTD